MKALDPDLRFWPKVNKTDTCWLWTASMTPGGYGRFTLTRSKWCVAHRWAYQRLVGPIPPGLQLDHLCRNPPCVNPAHLEPVTQRVNQLRGVGFVGVKAAQTECVNGHAFTSDNTYIRPNGTRRCRICCRARGRRYKARKAAQVAA